MGNVEKYKHMALNNVTSRWKSINLYNLSKELTVKEAHEVLDHLRPIMIERREQRVARLEELNAPEVIMVSERKFLRQVKRSMDPILRPLVRRIAGTL